MTHRPGSPFEGTAAYYDRFRAPYAPQALRSLAAAFGLGAGARALDLGCGPGTIAIPLSASVSQVTAIDRDAGMIAEGRRLAAERGRVNIDWIEGDAEDLTADLGRFRLAVLGQSFHWMDRDRVLGRLADLIEDGGGVALLNPGKRRPQESWEATAAEVVTGFLGPVRRSPLANPEPEHEPALLRSACFSAFTVREFPHEITRDVASILGYLYSTTGAAKARFGDRTSQFEAALEAALLKLNPSGVFKERIETEVLLAPKSRR